MGGKLFPNKTKRLSKPEFDLISSEVGSFLINLGFKNFEITKSVGEKLDFGDIDILIDQNYNLGPQNIKSHFKTDLIESLSNGISFVYKETQVDLIKINWKHKDIESLFYDWNDLGNMIGRLCKYFRCKLRPTGLSFVLYDSEDRSKKIGDYFLTDSPERVFELLGLNWERYKKGFQTFNEMFRFVEECKYFNKSFFIDREYNTGAALKRDQERKVYLKFVEYLEGTEVSGVRRKTIEECVDILDWEFKEVGLKRKIEGSLEEERIRRLIRDKWNGRIVMKVTGLEGIKLGKFMKWVGDKIGDKSQFLDMEDVEIEKWIRDKFNDWKFSKEFLD